MTRATLNCVHVGGCASFPLLSSDPCGMYVIFFTQVLQRQAGIGVLRQQERHGDPRGIPCPRHGLREENGLPGDIGFALHRHPLEREATHSFLPHWFSSVVFHGRSAKTLFGGVHYCAYFQIYLVVAGDLCTNVCRW